MFPSREIFAMKGAARCPTIRRIFGSALRKISASIPRTQSSAWHEQVVRGLGDSVRWQFSYIVVPHCDDSFYILSIENLHLSIETAFKSKSRSW